MLVNQIHTVSLADPYTYQVSVCSIRKGHTLRKYLILIIMFLETRHLQIMKVSEMLLIKPDEGVCARVSVCLRAERSLCVCVCVCVCVCACVLLL